VIKGDYLYPGSFAKQFRPLDNRAVTILDKNFKVVSNLGGSEPQYVDHKLGEMYRQ
jgi:hypothetical protein